MDQARGLYIVADGIGGRPAGALASETACKAVSDHLPISAVKRLQSSASGVFGQPATSALESALFEANRQLIAIGESDTALRGLGTTILVALHLDDILITAHVGDVRAYIIRYDAITALTVDHSAVADLVELGSITTAEARTHPRRNLVTRAVGAAKDLQPSVETVKLTAGDSIIICTDGLWSVMEEDEILRVVSRRVDPESTAGGLISQARRLGSKDDASCIVITFHT